LFDADIETARRQTNNKKATEKDFQQKRIKWNGQQLSPCTNR
jgi:hypothetical protein